MNPVHSIVLFLITNPNNIKYLSVEIGGAKQDRTADLLRARQALSQLSYSPIFRWLVFQIQRVQLELLESTETRHHFT